MAVFTGNANPALAQEIARHLTVPLGRAYVGRFSDGEVTVELMENVRGRDVYIVQPTSAPANDTLMELLVYPAIFYLWRSRGLPGAPGPGATPSPEPAPAGSG